MSEWMYWTRILTITALTLIASQCAPNSGKPNNHIPVALHGYWRDAELVLTIAPTSIKQHAYSVCELYRTQKIERSPSNILFSGIFKCYAPGEVFKADIELHLNQGQISYTAKNRTSGAITHAQLRPAPELAPPKPKGCCC